MPVRQSVTLKLFTEVSPLTEDQSKYVSYGQIGQVHVRRVSMNNR